jgi:hypothetical protein
MGAGSAFSFFVLEGDAGGEEEGVVVGVEMADGDMLASAEGEAEAAGFAAGVVAEWDAAKGEAGGEEECDIAVVRAPLIEAGVGFQLRPEEAAYARASRRGIGPRCSR